MNFKEIYNPRYVYEGFFETYFIRPFIHQYFQFQGREAVESCLKSVAAWIIITLGLVGIMLGQIGIIGPDGGIQLAKIIFWIWGGLSVIPFASLISRTVQGAPEHPLKSKILGIDTLLGASCVLFFVLGLMMMITTLDSGILNPNARVVEETDSIPFEEDYVKEEPIFTYQNDEATDQSEIIDSMTDINEPYLMEADESYDPTLEQPLDIAVDTLGY